MNTKLRLTPRLVCLLVLGFGVTFASPGFSQSTPKPTTSSTTEDEAVKLKEFVVTDSEDVGYSTPNAVGVGRFPTALIDTPQTINVLNRQFMDDFQAAELFDVLKYVAAVSIESNVGDSVQVRGYTVRDQYTDGVVDNQNQSQMGAEPFQFERIEVMKGPSALVYGSTAIGGVTNRVRKTPLWKPKGELGLTIGNHNQIKTDFDYTRPLGKSVSVRLIATYRNEDIVNNVAARFAYARRYNINPMFTWRVSPNTQLRIVGEFLHEKSYKHWGENGMFQPFVPVKGYTVVPKGLTLAQGGFTTWGLLPRDFTFGEKQAHVRNDKQAGSIYYEMQPMKDLMVRVFGTVSFWDHFVEDVIPIGMAANNREMTRLWRTIGNDDFYVTGGLDSSYRLNLPGNDHRLLFVTQYTTRRLWQEIVQDPTNPIPNLDLFNPIYAPFTPKTPRQTNYQFTNAGNHNFSFQDHVKFLQEKFQVVGGARFDKFNTRTDNVLTRVNGRTNFGDAWTYKYGAIIKPTKSGSLFYNHSETYAPNFGSQPDGTAFEPQLGVIEEVGFKLAMFDGRIAGTISMYDLQLQNLLTADPDPVRAAQGWRIQIAKQQTKGVELDIFFNVTRNWSFNIGGAKMEVTLPSGLYPRGSPRSTANFNTRYKFSSGEGPLKFLKGVTIGGGVMHKGPAPVDALNSYYLPKYTVGDIFANYTWGKYRFALNVNNFTDKWYLARAVSKEQVFQGSDRIIKFRLTRTF